MTEKEAAELEAQIARHVRFRVAGRRTVAGKGVYLDVVDTQSGYRHRVHSHEHWRQLFNELVLIVEGAWEDVTIAALKQLDDAIADIDRVTRPRGQRPKGVAQRRRVLRAQRSALYQALNLVSDAAEHSSQTGQEPFPSERQEHPKGSIGFYIKRDVMWFGRFAAGGRRYTVSGATEARCRERFEAKRREVRELGLTPSRGGVRAQHRVKRFWMGQVGKDYRNYSCEASTREACEAKLEALKSRLGLLTEESAA